MKTEFEERIAELEKQAENRGLISRPPLTCALPLIRDLHAALLKEREENNRICAEWRLANIAGNDRIQALENELRKAWGETVEAFFAEVCKRAEAKIALTGKLEGAHFASMQEILAERRALKELGPAEPKETEK